MCGLQTMHVKSTERLSYHALKADGVHSVIFRRASGICGELFHLPLPLPLAFPLEPGLLREEEPSPPSLRDLTSRSSCSPLE